MRVVWDTNVFVSAMLFPGRVPDQVLKSVVRDHRWYVSIPLAFEYGAELGRQKFQVAGISRWR